ncbi:hypothetical protein [Pseudoneobacillus sp. C159]
MASKKVNRKWTKKEIEVMLQYIKERQEEGSINITELLEEVAQLLNRGYQSVNYKYYAIQKELNEQQNKKLKDFTFMTINQTEVPVISTEVIHDKTFVSKINSPTTSVNGIDLIDILSGLITNVQQLPGIDLHVLLRSLYQLSNMAIQNHAPILNIEHLTKLEHQLAVEKRKNEQLQSKLANIASEVKMFSQLDDAEKIKDLKSYNTRLNLIINDFEELRKLGS